MENEKRIFSNDALFFVVCQGQSQSDYYKKDILTKDLYFFKEKLTNIHPIFLHSVFFTNWQNEFGKSKALLKDNMTLNEFYLIVAPLCAMLNDAHSNFLCPMEPRRKFIKYDRL